MAGCRVWLLLQLFRFRAFGGHFVRCSCYEHGKVTLHFLLQMGLTSSHIVCDTLHIARLRTNKDWGIAMSGEVTLYGMYESVDMAAREIVDDNPGVGVEDLGDQITEQADSLVSVHYAECAREWILAGMPDAADYYGGEYGEDDNIHKRISLSMYFWYEWQLRESVEELLEEIDNDNEEGN